MLLKSDYEYLFMCKLTGKFTILAPITKITEVPNDPTKCWVEPVNYIVQEDLKRKKVSVKTFNSFKLAYIGEIGKSKIKPKLKRNK